MPLVTKAQTLLPMPTNLPGPATSGCPAADSSAASATYPVRTLALHLLLLLGSCLVAFHCNRTNLFLGYDGAYYRTIIKLQHTWMPVRPWLSANPFQGLGNVFFVINSHLSPAYGTAAYLGHGEPSPLLVYTIMAMEIFITMLFLCRLLGVHQSAGYGAAWIITLLSFPFTPRPLLYPIAFLCPQYLEAVVFLTLPVALLWQVGRHSLFCSLGCVVLLFILLLWGVIAAPWMPILFLPILGLFALAMLLPGPTRARRFRLLTLTILLCSLAPTAGPYVLGNYLYSVPTFFTGELENLRFDRIWVSILFHRAAQGWFGPIFVTGGLFGACFALVRGSLILRTLAFATLTASLGLIAIGLAITFWLPNYVGPSPLYFEICLWPFYALFFSQLVCAAAASLCLRGKCATRKVPVCCFSLGFLLLPLSCLLWSSTTSNSYQDQQLNYPLPASSLVQTLHANIGLVPGSPFHGAVASFSRIHRNVKGVSYTDLLTFDAISLSQTGNDHRALGLWYYGIPTLHEYNQFMTPAYYAAMSRLLADPSDKQLRSVIVLTRPDLSYLRSLGIRYLLMDFPDPSWSAQLGLRCIQSLSFGSTGTSLHLYELTDPNLGCYSPTTIRMASTAEGILAQLTRPGFDFREEAVLATPIPMSLVPASSVHMTFHKGHALIEATSPGTSLLLLPLQYSHCLEIDPLSLSSAHEPRLLRVNLLQAGLLFSGSIRARLLFASGPFRNPYGRLHDYFDMKTLQLDRLGRTNSTSPVPHP